MFHNVPLTELALPELRFESIPFETNRTELDLVLHVYEARQGIRAVFEYRTGLFEAATIVRFAELLWLLLQSVLAHPGTSLSALMDFLAQHDRALRSAARAEQRASRLDRLQAAKRGRIRAGFWCRPYCFHCFHKLIVQGQTMNTTKSKPMLGTVRRRPIPLDRREFVRHGYLPGCGSLPLVIEAQVEGLSLSARAAGRRAELETLATRHGAVLLRGFAVSGVPDFEVCVDRVCGGALEYQFRASPRTEVGRHVYTATDYPADQVIFPHSEHSYSPVCPNYLVFYGERPAPKGGETPIGDSREITRLIDPAVKEQFRRLGILYVRNYGAGFGLPWPVVFQTSDPMSVERYCASAGIDWEWKSSNWLCTRQCGPAMIHHPRTKEEVWFNHATFFRVTTLPAPMQVALLAVFAEDDLPANTYYGDGTPIEQETLQHLRSIYRDSLHEFAWQTNDVLMLDTILTVHSRNPYQGSRRILVAMAQAFQPRDWAVDLGTSA
ncbi:MAG: TauD/TfdA family dioxygenase [Methylocella sp.]